MTNNNVDKNIETIFNGVTFEELHKQKLLEVEAIIKKYLHKLLHFGII